MGTGVAPGVRHNPVFGSPGEEFPPLPLNPPPSPTTNTVPWSQGHLLGSLKQGVLPPNPVLQGYGGTGASPA